MGLTKHLTEIAERFALGIDPTLVGAVERGELGQVRRLVTSNGSWALKVLEHYPGEDEVEGTARFQEAAVIAGVPAPDVIRTDTSRVLLELDGVAVRVYTWVEIQPPNIHLDPAQVGQVLASMHRLNYPYVGITRPWYTEPVGAARWDQLIDALREAGSPLADDLAQSRDELDGLETLLEAPHHLRRLHLDLWADNLRATATGDLCVIDWDNAGPGDPSQELAVVLFEYGATDPARTRALYAAYRDAGGPGRVTRRGHFSMAIAQLGHILSWQCQNWLEAGLGEQRDHACEEIADYLSRPLTRSVIAQILDAVTA